MDDPLDEAVIKTDFDSGSERTPVHYEYFGFGFEKPQRDSPVKSNFEENGSLGGHVHVSHTDTITNLGESPSSTIPTKGVVIPHKVSRTDSFAEKVRTPGISVHISNMDTNVTMGKGMKHREAHGTSSLETSFVHTTLIISSTIETTLIDTPTYLPPFFSPIPSSLPAFTIS